MRRIYTALSLALLLFMFTTSVVLAATWEYIYPTKVLDTSDATRTYYPVDLGYGAQSVISAGYLTDNCTDSEMMIAGTPIKYMMATDHVMAVVPTLPAHSTATCDLYTGYSPAQTAFANVFGDGGYVTVSDAAGLELGDNWTIEQSIYVDTDVGSLEYLLNKENAIKVFVSPTVSGNITAAVTTGNQTADAFDDPDVSWTNDANCSDGDISTRAHAVPGAPGTTGFLYQTWNTPIYVNAVTFMVDIQTKQAADYVDVDYYDVDKAAWNGAYNGNPDNLTWTTELLANSGAYYSCNGTRVRFYNAAGAADEMRIQEIHLKSEAHATATGIAPGERTVYLTLETPFVGLAVDAGPVLPVTTGLTFNAPMWQPQLDANPFSTIDGTGYAGTLNAPNPTWTDMGYDFTGGYISIPAGASWDFAGDFTIECWYNLDNLNRNIVKSVSNQNWGAAAANDWLVDVGADAKFRLYLKGGAITTGATNIATGAWNQSVVTRSGTALTVYLNGSDDTAGAPTSAATYGNTQALEFGRAQAALDAAMDGRMGEIRIYKGKALSAAEVLQNYNATKWKYDGVTIDQPLYSMSGSVNDTADDWVFQDGSASLPYANYHDIVIDGVDVLRFDPVAKIVGDTLVNEDNPGTYDGTITWGTNADITITYGEMEASGSTTISTTEDEGYTPASVPLPGNWYGGGAGLANMPLYDSINPMCIDAGIPTITVYLWIIFGLALMLFLILTVSTKSVVAGCIGMLVVLFWGSDQTILATWIPFAVVLAQFSIMYLYHTLGGK